MRSKEAVGDVLWVNTSALQSDKNNVIIFIVI
jgi:hypothetical protein